MTTSLASLSDVVAAVQARGGQASKQPDDSFMLACPVHDDRNPSLHVPRPEEITFFPTFAREISRRSVAYHEAGHAVAAHVQRCTTPGMVTIIPDAKTLGRAEDKVPLGPWELTGSH